MLARIALLGATPVVDIDGTLLVQAGLFVLLMLVLNPLLFQPWLRVQAQRKQAIEGSLHHAEQMQQKSEGLLQSYQQRIATARDEATRTRNAARRELEAVQAKRLAEIRDGVGRELEQERSRLASEAATAKAALSTRIDELASQIAKKLLGRPN